MNIQGWISAKLKRHKFYNRTSISQKKKGESENETKPDYECNENEKIDEIGEESALYEGNGLIDGYASDENYDLDENYD